MTKQYKIKRAWDRLGELETHNLRLISPETIADKKTRTLAYSALDLVLPYHVYFKYDDLEMTIAAMLKDTERNVTGFWDMTDHTHIVLGRSLRFRFQHQEDAVMMRLRFEGVSRTRMPKG